MRSILVVPATAVGIALIACGVAVADTVTADFERPAFQPGTVNGQDGWKSAVPGDVPALPLGYDQEIFTNSGAPSAFGQQSLRMSNRYANSEFFYQTYSRPVTSPAGETQDNSEYIGQVSFISTRPSAEQPGLFMSVSPDSNEGSRMQYVGLEDTPEGIRVTVIDAPEPDGRFVSFDAGVLDRRVPHTIRFWIKVNPGEDNDLVRIFIDGVDLGQCFTTWENYYRTHPEQAPPPNINNPASISSFQFRSSVTWSNPVAPPAGYLFDNVSVTTADGRGPRDCSVVVDKEAEERTVRAGGQASYQITVRNRGRTTARNLWACDRLPRRTTFVSSDRRLRRFGQRRCLEVPTLRPGQRERFNVVLRVEADAPQGALENNVEIIPGVEPPGLFGGQTPGGAPSLPAGDVPTRPSSRIKPIAVARAIVRVRQRPPRVTG